MHVYARIMRVCTLFSDILAQEERKGQPAAEGNTPVQQAFKKISKQFKMPLKISGLEPPSTWSREVYAATMPVWL